MRIHNDPSLSLLAARSMLVRLDTMVSHVDGVRRAEDVEAVHQLRVASRRLRAALQLFGPVFPARRVKGWRTEVRQVTRALGPARDTDVQIEFLTRFLADLEDRQASFGVRRLLLRLEQRRAKQQPKVRRAMSHLEDSGLFDDMGRTLRQILTQARLRGIEDRSEAVSRAGRAAIRKRVESLLSYETFVSRPERIRELHNMRIVAKRLRYSLEIYAPAYDGALDPAVRQVKRLQTLLGDLHDCDVWIEQLPEFVDTERGRILDFYGRPRDFARLERGVDALAQDRARERRRVYDKFASAWDSLEEEKAWEQLLAVLDAHVPPPAGSSDVDAGKAGSPGDVPAASGGDIPA